jgi:hypothetical protein
MPLIFLISLAAFLYPALVPPSYNFLAIFNLVVGLGMHVFFAWHVVKVSHWKGMEKYCFLFPFYWLLHMLASFRAVWQLIERPHYWEKTDHGLTKMAPQNPTL